MNADGLKAARRSFAAREKVNDGCTGPRAYRRTRRVTLLEAALAAGLSVGRASFIERFPERARFGEVERLKAAIDAVADPAAEVAS